MKRLVISLALVLLVIAVPVHVKSQTQNEKIEQLSSEVAEAYEAKDLGKLDSRKPYFGKIKIIMQHSLSAPSVTLGLFQETTTPRSN